MGWQPVASDELGYGWHVHVEHLGDHGDSHAVFGQRMEDHTGAAAPVPYFIPGGSSLFFP